MAFYMNLEHFSNLRNWMLNILVLLIPVLQIRTSMDPFHFDLQDPDPFHETDPNTDPGS